MKVSLRVCSEIFLALCLAASGAKAAPINGAPAARAAWSFEENFRSGIPGWISYPLAQDEGYDPSIYTADIDGSPALVRDVIAYGQRVLRVGMLRPIRFYATPATAVDLKYELKACDPVTSARVILAATSGRKYIAAIPSSAGAHTLRLGGERFGLPAQGAAIGAILVEAEIAHPLRGSHNRLALLSFRIDAQRRPLLPLQQPELAISPVSSIAVAARAVTPQAPLIIFLLAGPPGARVLLKDGAGKLIREEPLQAQTGGREVRFTPSGRDPGLWSARVQSAAGARPFRFLVLGRIPPHPRVLLTPARLAQLKSMAGSSMLLRSIGREAAELRASLAYNDRAGESITLLSPASVFPGLVQYFQLMEKYSRAIAFNALDYRLNGNQDALESVRRALLTISAWPTWTPPWFHDHGLQTYYEVGVFTQRMAVGYDLVADQLSPNEKSRIASALWRNSIQPTLADYFFNDRLPTASSNHMANSVGGALAACGALYGDSPQWNARLGGALAELISAYENLLQGLFPGDGSEAEPAGYEDFAMEGMSFGAAALHALGIRPRGMAKMIESFWWLRYAFFAPGEVLDTGDTGMNLGSLSGYAWGAENGRDPAVRTFYDSARTGTLAEFISSAGTGKPEPPGLLDLACCTGPSPAVPPPPLARIFTGRGSAVMRSGWAPGSTVISLRAGPWWNHQHHDEGSFQAAAFGEPLIAEAGYADYYRDPRYADYFSQAPGHNTVLLDHDPFSQEGYDGRYWPALQKFPRFRGHVFSPAIDFISANLAPAYNDGAHLNSFVRDYTFIAPDVLIVHDALRASEPHQYTFLLHAPPGDPVGAAGAGGVIRGKAAFAAITAGGANRHWTMHSAPVPENAYVDLDRVNVLPRKVLRLDSASAPGTDFLVAIRFQNSSEPAARLTATVGNTGEGFRSADDRVAVVFRTGQGQLELPGVPGLREITTDGDVLAAIQRGPSTDVLVARARSVRAGGSALLSSMPSALDAVITESATGEVIEADCLAGTSLLVRATQSPRTVTLDGAAAAVRLQGGMISFPRLSQGEHVIRIEY
ncbi:MAG: heparinase II/III domain-containing protein [Terriglobia bacterium]